MMNSENVRVSRDQFAEVLYYWLSGYLTKKAIKKKAKELHFKIRGNKAFNKIFDELLVFNMWLIVYTCEGVFEDEDKRNDCLDIFHHLVYERHAEGTGEDFGKWMKSMGAKYIEYDKARQTDHPSTPLWVVAKLFNKSLFGEIKEDLIAQTKIVLHQGLFVEHLGKAIKQYDIE